MSAASDSLRAPDFEIERLRDPHEARAVAICMLTNVAVVAIAIVVLIAGTEWLRDHPRLARWASTFQVIAVTAVLAFPATVIGRRAKFSAAEGNAVRVDERNLPELQGALVRACTKLGLESIPELFLGRVSGGPAAAFTAAGGRSCIVLDSDLLIDKDYQRGLDWISFVIAGAVGAIRLGHTQWWVELITAYAKRIPGLRTPLLLAWARSRDRCAAYVVPDGIRGLVIEATGKDAIWEIDVGRFVTQPIEHGFWDLIAMMQLRKPHLVHRARALYDAGLFDLERDRERFAARSRDDDDD